jgi:hypothetical protein
MKRKILCLLLTLILFLTGCGTFTLVPVTEPAAGEQPTPAVEKQTTPATAVSDPTPTGTDSETVLADAPLLASTPPGFEVPVITPPAIDVPEPSPPRIEAPEIEPPTLGWTATAVSAEIVAITDTPFLANWQPADFSPGRTAERQIVNMQLLLKLSVLPWMRLRPKRWPR